MEGNRFHHSLEQPLELSDSIGITSASASERGRMGNIRLESGWVMFATGARLYTYALMLIEI